MNSSELIVDQERRRLLQGECEKVIDTRKRLPEFVFRHPFAKYFAIEYGHIYGRKFGSFLRQLSVISEEDAVNYMALDPSPESYYPQSAFFGAASFKPFSLPERYVPAISREGNVPGLLAGVNVGVFWGSSLKWGIFSDRISWEMAVIAVSEKVDVATIGGFRCMDAAAVSSYMKSQYHWKPSAASEFTQRFLAHYPI